MGILRRTLSTYQDRGLRSVLRGGCRILNQNIRNGFTEAHGNPDGVCIFDRDWDNLVILDACRHDYFRDAIHDYDIEGELSTHQSLGSCSREFVQRNFDGRQLHDVAVLSVNLWYEQAQRDFDVDLDVHRLKLITEREDRGHGREIVYPDHVTEQLEEFVAAYPNKRLLIHFHQPHAPYIGPTANEHKDPESHPFGIPLKYARQAYRETLHEILTELSGVVDTLDGKTVISSDHGELLGDRGWPIPVQLYGHPCEHYHEKLTTVPWFEVEYDQRRTITAEEPTESRETMDTEEREQRLKDLGYLQ